MTNTPWDPAQNAPLRRPRAILFDHDGVLVESESLHSEAWGILLGELGLPYDPASFRRLVGKTAPQILARLLDEFRPGWSPAEFDLDALALRKNDHFLRLARGGLRAYPGVREGLEWLRREGIRAAVVSNAKRRELVAAHEQLGTAPLFDALIARDDSGAAKPDPTPYLVGAATVGFEPADCLAVEDSAPGLAAALLAGVPAVGLLTSGPAEHLLHAVPGRPDLRPIAIYRDAADFFAALRAAPPRAV